MLASPFPELLLGVDLHGQGGEDGAAELRGLLVCMYKRKDICIYIYIYRERERCVCIYIYIYTHIIHMYRWQLPEICF